MLLFERVPCCDKFRLEVTWK